MRTADVFPLFKDGWIVIDVTDAPALRNAIGSRIYRKRYYAEAAAEKARRSVYPPEEAVARIQVVQVDGANRYFALDYIDASDVVVRSDGQIRMAGANI